MKRILVLTLCIILTLSLCSCKHELEYEEKVKIDDLDVVKIDPNEGKNKLFDNVHTILDTVKDKDSIEPVDANYGIDVDNNYNLEQAKLYIDGDEFCDAMFGDPFIGLTKRVYDYEKPNVNGFKDYKFYTLLNKNDESLDVTIPLPEFYGNGHFNPILNKYKYDYLVHDELDEKFKQLKDGRVEDYVGFDFEPFEIEENGMNYSIYPTFRVNVFNVSDDLDYKLEVCDTIRQNIFDGAYIDGIDLPTVKGLICDNFGGSTFNIRDKIYSDENEISQNLCTNICFLVDEHTLVDIHVRSIGLAYEKGNSFAEYSPEFVQEQMSILLDKMMIVEDDFFSAYNLTNLLTAVRSSSNIQQLYINGSNVE